MTLKLRRAGLREILQQNFFSFVIGSRELPRFAFSSQQQELTDFY